MPSISRVLMLNCLVVCLLLTGCRQPVREQVFREDGPTTEQVWHGAGPDSPLLEDRTAWNPGNPSGPGAAAWTRSAGNELDALFPLLRNRRIHLYVFPHITADGAPVPGYVTRFTLYGKPHFALPGEALREGSRF